MVHARLLGRRQLRPVRAIAAHNVVGIGWDTTYKQRGGWSVGESGGAPWCAWSVRFGVLAELFSWAFKGLAVRPSEHSVLVVSLPGLWTPHVRARVVRVLTGRFEVPRVYVAPAPLCALLAHGLVTGTVVWGCSLGESVVRCYRGAQEVAAAGPFDFHGACASDIVQLLSELSATAPPEALQQIVFSVHGVVARDPGTRQPPRGLARLNVTEEEEARIRERIAAPQGLGWLDAARIHTLLREGRGEVPACLLHAALRVPIADDVMLGAEALAVAPGRLDEFSATPDEVRRWEWRQFIDGAWRRLPAYVVGVFESALRSGARYAGVQVGYAQADDHEADYLVADLKLFVVGVGSRTSDFGSGEASRYKLSKDRRKLTRFPRGSWSPVPDRRLPPQSSQLGDSLESLYGAELAELYAENGGVDGTEPIPEDMPGDYGDLVQLGSGGAQQAACGDHAHFRGLDEDDDDDFNDGDSEPDEENGATPLRYVGGAWDIGSGGAGESGDARGGELVWDLCNFVQQYDLNPAVGVGQLICCGLERAGYRRTAQLRSLTYANFLHAFPGASHAGAPAERCFQVEQLEKAETRVCHSYTRRTSEREQSAARAEAEQCQLKLKQLDSTPERVRLQVVRLAAEHFWSIEGHKLPAALDPAFQDLEHAYDPEFVLPWAEESSE
eukprot:NODE_2533_length_2194_cov_13.721335.p1 GENE.NODE_2533_length_2194_cov_13.721335~~NODE_2533_length_2194_cov_13.721335.p1  ORF type:complete len:670 (+),score=174.81 NODE_2533_length_2194_cov_13.721335:3-2012(+)